MNELRYGPCFDIVAESLKIAVIRAASVADENGEARKELRSLLKQKPELTVGEFSRRWAFYLKRRMEAHLPISLANFCQLFDGFDEREKMNCPNCGSNCISKSN